MNKRAHEEGRQTTSIAAVVDCVGSLATGSLAGNLYLYDTNKSGGSTGHGSEDLHTRVKVGDQLLWTAFGLECETFLRIAEISMDETVCVPERHLYPGTDVSYWIATVKKNPIGELPYRLAFTVGARREPMFAPRSPVLFGTDQATA
ncbi:MAG TPA: hypothetical protein VI248_10260 [Kineosporiaceae bacterium]